MTPIDLGHHGDTEVQPGLVDFVVNVAVPAPPGWLFRQLECALDEVARYPDVAPAVDALARLHGCRPASLLVTNGAAEAFTLVARARRWRRPLVVHPQFTGPESALQASGHAAARLILRQVDGFTLDPAKVPTDADLVVIGNPTNPTSRTAHRHRARRRPRACRSLRPGPSSARCPASRRPAEERSCRTPGRHVPRSGTRLAADRRP